MSEPATQFLYLSTLGSKTGKRHRIEIWFVEHDGRYYVLSERKENAHWVKNIVHEPQVSFIVSGKNSDGKARVVSAEKENALATKISGLMKEKYGWGDGLIIELMPEN
jgi:deazaflavin-dependent oxidoreductase (nitroreductase family)